jgi:hypothetical protein
MSQLLIPMFRDRPLILFPEGWIHGWMDRDNKLDPNADFAREWSLEDWKGFRDDYYSGLMLSPFGYDTSDPLGPWPGVPYAPWGISEKYREPKLHPADE